VQHDETMHRARYLSLASSFLLACSTSPTTPGNGGAGGDEGEPDASVKVDAKPKRDTAEPDEAQEPDGPPPATDVGPPREENFPEHPVTLPIPVGGTRLKLMVSQPVDGPEVLRNWFDDLRKEPCAFAWAADGVVRCLPVENLFTYEPAFADPACKMPAVVRSLGNCPATPLSYVTTTRPSCPQATIIARLGDKLAASAVYRLVGGVCVPRGAALQPNQEAHAIGEEIPPAMFAAGKLVVGDAKGGRLAPVFVEGDDGSRMFRSWRDTTTGADCFSALATDGTYRCLPSSVPIESFVRSDTSCMVQAITSPKSSCADADKRFVVQQISNQCPPGVQVSRLGGKLTGAFSSPAAGQCTAAVVDDGTDIWAVAVPAVDPTTFAPMTAGVTGGGTRLRARTDGTVAGTVIAPAYWDAKLHTRCSSAVASDGVIRCLPSRLAPPVYYDDAACAGTPGVAFVSTGECEIAYVGRTDTACPPRAHVFALGEPYLGATYRMDAQGACIRVMARAGFQPYRVGAEVAATEFVEVRRP
jgi:hypothetical protein